VNGCYKLVSRNLSWTAAAQECRSLHPDAHLLVIEDAKKQLKVAGWLASNRQSLSFHLYQRVRNKLCKPLVSPEEECPSVYPSVCPTHSGIVSKRKKASVVISSPSESLNILVSRNTWLITKFDRGHPERGRFMRLRWVRTGDFCEFSTNKRPNLRNDAR